MTEKIIIIGAGMAGIAAARSLHDAGYDVTILEARDRIGGRTHTDYSLSHPVDLGASWIHGYDSNPMTPLAHELHLEMGYTDFLNRSQTAVQAFAEDGRLLDTAEYTQGLHLGAASFYQAAGSLLSDRPTNARTLKDWVEHGLPKPDGLSDAAEAGFRYQSLISTEYVAAADWDELDLVLAEQHVSLPGGDYLLHGRKDRGGYKVIVDHLADGLDLRVETAVSRIEVTESGVELSTSAGPLSCAKLIITVPLGVLKSGSIEFVPSLPQEKRDAIDRIGFGIYEKLAMRFDKFYWPKEAQRFNYLSTGEPSLFHAWLNIGHYTGEPIIVAYHAHRRARHINQMSDGELLEQTVGVMQRIFGGEPSQGGYGKIPAPEAYVRTSWEHDPFSQGSYSFDKFGQQPDDRQTLAQPIEGRLFFAGEATHPHFHSSVHGAYETGVRAAREIMAAAV